jgi:transposase
MAAAIGVRTDYTSTDLRCFARRCGDGDQVRRLLAVALILDGGSRSDAAKVAGVTLQIVRDWVVRFNEGGPDGLATRKAPGRTSILNDEQRAKLAEIIETGPIPAAATLGTSSQNRPGASCPWHLGTTSMVSDASVPRRRR